MRKIFIIINICLVFFTIELASQSNKDVYIQKVILYQNEQNNHSPILPFLNKTIISVLKEMDFNNQIIFIKEEYWVKQKHLLNHLDNKIQMSQFYLKTDVQGIITAFVTEENNQNRILLKMVQTVEQKQNEYTLSVQKNNFFNQIEQVHQFIQNAIEQEFPPITYQVSFQQKMQLTNQARDNPYYELFLSGGSGFLSCYTDEYFFSGFSIYTNINAKINKFVLNSHLDFSPLFHSKTSDIGLIYRLIWQMDFGGVFYGEMIRISGGCGYLNGKIFYSDWNHINEFTFFYHLMRLYIGMGFSPTQSFQFNINFGWIFLPSSDFNSIGAGRHFPLYIDLSFKFIFKNDLFMEMIVHYYQIKYLVLGDEENMNSFTLINIGLGKRLSWRNK